MDEWNATLTADYLWTNMMVGEVFPTATTPSTWSVWQDFFDMLSMGDSPTIQRIAGRPYLNYSLMYSFLVKIARKPERALDLVKDSVGVPPPGVSIPPFPVSWRTVILQVLFREVRNELKKARLRKRAPEFLVMVREQCEMLGHRIRGAAADELIALWTRQIRPLWKEIHPLQDKMNEELNRLTQKLKADLIRLSGIEDANALLTTVSSAGELASLAPLAGLARVSRGELSRKEYMRHYGHRGALENELAEPRPHEDLDWLDRQLADFEQSPADIAELLARRDAEASAVLEDIKRKLSTKDGQTIERKVNMIAETNTLREATRSELTRLVSVIRAWFLRAGTVSGLGDGVFFLTVREVVDVLVGSPNGAEWAAQIDARREAYEKYRSLPPLPQWIVGRFDPFQWAADPNRRRNVFDAQASGPPAAPSADRVIRGQPGSAGRVEGIVRRIDSPDEGHRLQSGEILVTSTTNVGWTPLFPRTAAVVTDIGGSLSHAAIVARELGIPAVVGCGDATIRLHTGDRVRVDGERGTVELLESHS